MTTKLTWRLSKLPTPDELRGLVNDKIITQEEAKEILFNKETEEDANVESLKNEIKFLRETIEKLSGNSVKTIEIIREVLPRYSSRPFYYPYGVYCGGGTAGPSYSMSSTTSAGTGTYTLTAGATNVSSGAGGPSNITDIQTF